MRNKVFSLQLMVLSVCTVAYGAAEQAEAEMPSPFSGTFSDAIWTIITFLVLLAVLWKLAWKPILAGLTSRAEHIEKQISDADNTRKEAEQVLAEYKSKLANVTEEGKKIIENHVKKAERQSKEVLDKAKTQTEIMKSKAEADITRAHHQAEEELLARSGEIVLELGQEILGRALNNDDNQKLIDEAIERLKHEENQ